MVCSNSAVVWLYKGRLRCRKCRFGQRVGGGYYLSSTQSMVLFHVKPTEKSFLSWQKAQQWFFDGVRNVADCIYYSRKRVSDYCILIFDASCWHKKAPIRHKRWNNMIFHPVHCKGNSFRGGIRFQIIYITRCESLRIEQDFIKFPCQPKISSMFTISYGAKTLA